MFIHPLRWPLFCPMWQSLEHCTLFFSCVCLFVCFNSSSSIFSFCFVLFLKIFVLKGIRDDRGASFYGSEHVVSCTLISVL